MTKDQIMLLNRAVRALRDTSRQGYSYIDGVARCDIANLLVVLERENKALQKQLEAAQPKWISVNDREPECGVEVLTCDGYNNIYVAYRFEENLYYRPDVDGYLAHFSASYWMPLPEPPKEGE